MDAASSGVENGHKYEEMMENGHQNGAQECGHANLQNRATCTHENGCQNAYYENGHASGLAYENGHTNGVTCENGHTNGVIPNRVAYHEKGHAANGATCTYKNGHGIGEFDAIESRDRGEGLWSLRASRESHDCINPIRQIEEHQFQDVLTTMRPDVEYIKLSIGKCPTCSYV